MSYKENAANAFQRFADREAALAVAFALIHRGHVVMEVGEAAARRRMRAAPPRSGG
jgi:hypothetical protein